MGVFARKIQYARSVPRVMSSGSLVLLVESKAKQSKAKQRVRVRFIQVGLGRYSTRTGTVEESERATFYC